MQGVGYQWYPCLVLDSLLYGMTKGSYRALARHVRRNGLSFIFCVPGSKDGLQMTLACVDLYILRPHA